MATVLPILAGASGVFATGALLFRVMRPKFPIRVNCWFCNVDTVVPYGNKNCWDCPHCDQYNGFTEDGDYNKPIPAQHNEYLNHSTPGSKTNTNQSYFSNGLCDYCNQNQHMKIWATANFVAQNEDHYDTEVDSFKEYLDRAYRLCRACEAVVRQTLGQQDTRLRAKFLGWKIQESCSNRSTKSSSSYSPFIVNSRPPRYFTVLRAFALLLVAAMLVSDLIQLEKRSQRRLFNVDTLLPQFVTTYVNLVHRFELETITCECILTALVLLLDKSSRQAVDVAAFFLSLVPFVLHTGVVDYVPYISGLEVFLLRPIACFVAVVTTIFAIFWTRHPPKFLRLPKQGPVKGNCAYTQAPFTSIGANSRSVLSGGSLQDAFVSTSSPQNKGLNTSLGAMTLGAPSFSSKSSGIFNLQTYQPNHSPLVANGRSSPDCFMALHHRRPILSPARLQCHNNRYSSSWVSNSSWNLPPPQRGSVWSRNTSGSVFGSNHSFSSSQFGSATIGNRTPTPPYSTYGDCNGSMFGGIKYRSNVFAASQPVSRQGSVCGDDRASVFSEPSFPSSSFLQQDTLSHYSNGRIPNGEGFDHSSDCNSSRSSSMCPVDTTTVSPDGSLDGTKSGPTWQKILLVFSASANIAVVLYYLSKYCWLHTWWFPPFSLSLKS